MKQFYWINILLACVCLLGACDDDDNTDFGPNGILIETPQVLQMTGSEATVSANISVRGDVRYTSLGFCYSTATNPTIYDATVESTLENGTVTATLKDLALQTTYYVRAFACIYEGATVYSDELRLASDETLADYQAPTYPDDYSAIAGWDQRAQWNLANVHDPSVVLAEDGYYYMYQTDASYGNAHEGHGHFHARRSKDLVNWEYLGASMSEAPAWVAEKVNEYRTSLGLPTIENPSLGYWAPVVRKVQNGLYRMYYSIVVSNYLGSGAASTEENFDNTWTERAFIGLMETNDPASNNWTDKGMVLCSSSDRGTDWSRPSLTDYDAYFKWNAIDPSYIITPEGTHYLIYGSWHSGIAAVEIDANIGMPANTLPNPWGTADDIAAYGTLIATRDMNSRWQGSEGPEIVYKDGYYYLFLAYDALEVPYNTRVVRSQNITGPYVGMDGTDVTANGGNALPVVTHPYKFANSDGWVGISHCAIFDDGQGNWYYASQGRLPAGVGGNEFSNAIMMGHVRSIRWTNDGWPLVMPERYGAVPQVPIAEEELAGTWEIIDLSYSYGTQKESTTMTLAADHTVSGGTWQGSTWSYNADNQVLTVNGTDLYLQREVDWEASPRTPTLVFAGYGSNCTTYWGKKNK